MEFHDYKMSLRDLGNMTKNQFNIGLEYQEVEAKRALEIVDFRAPPPIGHICCIPAQVQ